MKFELTKTEAHSVLLALGTQKNSLEREVETAKKAGKSSEFMEEMVERECECLLKLELYVKNKLEKEEIK
jgi:hypothetical protein